uniref:Uncharacterized protein n=1 Tax=Rhizophora mucronata TaxID=61149 RepID=A0A2P2PFQ5_RHIMU
MRLLLWTPYPL